MQMAAALKPLKPEQVVELPRAYLKALKYLQEDLFPVDEIQICSLLGLFWRTLHPCCHSPRAFEEEVVY